MHQEEENAVLEENVISDNSSVRYYSGNEKAVIAICAALCVLFMKTGFFSFFFLVPLGYAVFVTGSLFAPFFAVTLPVAYEEETLAPKIITPANPPVSCLVVCVEVLVEIP